MNNNYLCKIIQIGTDLFSCLVSFPIAIYLLSYISTDFYQFVPYNEIFERILLHIVLSLICVTWFWIRLRHYTYRKPFWFELKEVLRTLIILSIVDLATLAFSKLYFSRYLWVLTWGIALFLVPIGRILVKKWLISIGWYLKDTFIIGCGKNAFDAYNALMSESYLGFNIKGFICDNINNLKLDISKLGIDIISHNHWYKVSHKNDQFILALEDNQNSQRDYWLRQLSKNQYRSISIIPTLRGLPLYSTDMSFIFSYDVILLRINNNLAKRSSRILKRTMDIILSLFFIILLSPVFLLLYLLINFSGGNAVYTHNRIGKNGKEFKCLKFRTMVNNSSAVLSDLLATSAEARAEWEKDFKLRNDPRLTWIGRYLRRYSLDELPQLWNVLKGEMSLVGPRPIVKEELERYEEDVDYYLMAKPGMTGLWQVSGRNDVDYETRVYFDSWYVKNWSLWNDIAILFKTINVVLKRDGAY